MREIVLHCKYIISSGFLPENLKVVVPIYISGKDELRHRGEAVLRNT